jgi:MFS family permease
LHIITIWHVLVLAALQGLINAFDTPARQSFVVDMIDAREDLPNAIALNSSIVNGARLVGPSVAGALIAAVGEGWCFALDAASYVAVIASLHGVLRHGAVWQPARRLARRAHRRARDGGMGGALTLVAAAVFARRLPILRDIARPLYRRLGILPEIASGLNVTAEVTRPPEE